MNQPNEKEVWIALDYMSNAMFDYAETKFFLQVDGIDYLSCMFEVDFPKVNKLRVAKVSLATGEVWMRKAKGKDEHDDVHLVTPELNGTMIEKLLQLGDDEIVDGNPVFFPIRASSRHDIRLRFFSSDRKNSILVSFV